MKEQEINPQVSRRQSLQSLFSRQRQAYDADPMPSAASRIALLRRLERELLTDKELLCAALDADYGGRHRQDTLLADILPCVTHLRYSRRRIKGWMRPQRRSAGSLLTPARIRVYYQPLGVVGIVVPWNFPILLALCPLIGALAAGNRVMLKLSEVTPRVNRRLVELLERVFTPDTVVCLEGDAELAADFVALPFDHLLFTGSTAVGQQVLQAAAEHLTPVTLELGGKSPALIAPDVDLDFAVRRMLFGKTLNAGQICVAPDYVLVPRDRITAFVDCYRRRFEQLYPEGVGSADYASVINQRQYQRLLKLLTDAEGQGARVFACCEGRHRDDGRRRLTTHLLLDVTDSMSLMQQEIFGPLLPVLPYDTLPEALEMIRRRPRPLALYLFSHDRDLQRRVIEQTHAGGMAINETVLQAAVDDAPFGGIGPSGMGHYRGREGFETFSKAKTVLVRGRFSTGTLLQPPYGSPWQQRLLRWFLR